MASRGRTLFQVDAPSRLYRVAYSPDIASFPDWYWQRGAGRWDHPLLAAMYRLLTSRFPDDEPEEHQLRFAALMRDQPPVPLPYRVLYAAGARVTAFIEVLQDLRPASRPLSRSTIDEIGRVVQDDAGIRTEKRVHTGVVPADHFEKMYVGALSIDARPFAMVTHIDSVQYVRDHLLEEAKDLGYSDVNISTILGVRGFTQLVGNLVYEDGHLLAGLHHASSLGEPHAIWAIFETPVDAQTIVRARVVTEQSMKIQVDDADLRQAADVLGIEIEGVAREIERIVEEQRESGAAETNLHDIPDSAP